MCARMSLLFEKVTEAQCGDPGFLGFALFECPASMPYLIHSKCEIAYKIDI